MGTLDGRVALVTGAAGGIGEVYARHLAQCGAVVVLADLDGQAAQARAATLADAGYRASALAVDISDPDQCEAAVAEVCAREGRLDILVNNAAYYSAIRSTLAEDIDTETWRRVVDVNINGMFFMCRAAIGPMKRQRSGCIVNQTSGSVFGAFAGMLHYVTTKAAAIPMTKVLARELGPFGIRVNAIAPGMTDTPATREVASQETMDRNVAVVALGRITEAEDLCGTLEYLCSDASAFVTGQTIAVNGGSNMLP
jgi:3-oxoacyl-[acyl-carrier protein] reductase